MLDRTTVIYACFALSGFAALLYQTAWMRQLATVFGTSDLAVATVLAAYMSGLALGAAIADRLLAEIRKPVFFYGILEAAIAVSALSVPWLFHLAGQAYVSLFSGDTDQLGSNDLSHSMFHLVATFLILALPTACMGATLPMLSSGLVRSDAQVSSRVGGLYVLNTVGAMGGTLIAGFLLLPGIGVRGTIYVGVIVNALVFALILLAEHQFSKSRSPPLNPKRSPFGWALPLMMMSGFASFAYEVLWTRMLSHVLGGSVYAFSTMLAAFLGGIALGAALAARIVRDRGRAPAAMVVAQLGTAGFSVLVYYLISNTVRPEAGLSVNVLFAVVCLFPATICIGATFPLAVRLLSPGPDEAASASARVYSWTTIGAIAGALIAGFTLIPELRYEGAIVLFACINLGLAALAAWHLPNRRGTYATAALLGAVFTAIFFRPGWPESALRSSPLSADGQGDVLYYDVGRTATVLMLAKDGRYYLRTNGLPEAAVVAQGTPPAVHTQSMLTALPALAHPSGTDMLVIGLGGGVSVENLAPSIGRVDVLEIERKVVQANRVIAELREHDPLADSRVHIHINDARGALALNSGKYDFIISQPSHPWTAGASHLYTSEFMALARSRLRDGGIFIQWMSTQFLDEPLFQSLASTLTSEFSHVQVYQFQPTELVFMASIEPLPNIAAWGNRLRGSAHPTYFHNTGLTSVETITAALIMDNAALVKFAAASTPITDNNNALAMHSAWVLDEKSGISYKQLQELSGEFHPIWGAQTNSVLAPLDYDFLAWHLETMQASVLTEHLLNTLKEANHSSAFSIRSRQHRYRGQVSEAERSAMQALKVDPSNLAALFSIALPRADRVADDNVPESLRVALNRLPDDGWAVLQSLPHNRAGNWRSARLNDARLAAAVPTAAWFIHAQKLRIDWRLRAAAHNPMESELLGQQAVAITDNALVVANDLDLLGMRFQSAVLAGSHTRAIESLRLVADAIENSLVASKVSRQQLQRHRSRLLVGLNYTPPNEHTFVELRLRLQRLMSEVESLLVER